MALHIYTSLFHYKEKLKNIESGMYQKEIEQIIQEANQNKVKYLEYTLTLSCV